MIFRKWGGGGQGLVGFQHRGVHFGVVDLLLLLFKISTDVYLMWYIQISATSLVFSSLLSLPSTVPSPTNWQVLYVFRHVEWINKFHVNHHQETVQRPLWRKFLLMWCILMSATSLVFSSRLSLPSTVSLTTNQFEQKVVKWGVKEKDFEWTSKCSTLVVCGLGRVEKNSTEVIHSICQLLPWSSPPGCPCRPGCH